MNQKNGMNDEQQIEEIAIVLCGMTKGCDGCTFNKEKCFEYQDAKRIYNAGYRKQEWHSIDERLPDEKGEYIVAFHPCWWDDVQEDKTVVGTDTFRGKTTWAKKKFQRVTHWMPLPEPPKMKGGAE